MLSHRDRMLQAGEILPFSRSFAPVDPRTARGAIGVKAQPVAAVWNTAPLLYTTLFQLDLSTTTGARKNTPRERKRGRLVLFELAILDLLYRVTLHCALWNNNAKTPKQGFFLGCDFSDALRLIRIALFYCRRMFPVVIKNPRRRCDQQQKPKHRAHFVTPFFSAR